MHLDFIIIYIKKSKNDRIKTILTVDLSFSIHRAHLIVLQHL